MKEFLYVITDPEGIHARPAGQLVKQANTYSSAILLHKGEKTGDAKRIFAVMSLAVKQGQEVRVTVEGADEETAAAAMEIFFKSNL